MRNLELWSKDSVKAVQTRRICEKHNEPSYYREAVEIRSAETVANIAIVLLHQADLMLCRMIERQKTNVLEQGCIREQMSCAGREYRSGDK